MTPLVHTLISTGLLAVAYYGGRWWGWRKGVRVGFSLGVYRSQMDSELAKLFETIDNEENEKDQEV